jgi:fructokinase
MADPELQAVAFGEILFDVFDDGAYLGGAPLNFPWYLFQFGIAVGIVSAIGNDGLGSQAQSVLRQAGISQAYVTCSDAPTGTVDVKLTNGQPHYTINQGVAWDQITLPQELPIAPHLLYFGTLAQRTEMNRLSLARLLQLVPEHRFFDINLRQNFFTDQIILDVLRNSTLAKLNEDEWQVLQRLCDAREPHDLVRRFGLPALIVTRGDRGASLYTANNEYHAASPAVEVVDAVGAGDAFSATIAAAALREMPLNEALPIACEVGAFVVTQRGAQAQLPVALRQAVGR